MRRVLLGVALGALLTILAAAPAGAVPPNEILIAKNLQRLGVVPSYATPGMARAAAQGARGQGDTAPGQTGRRYQDLGRRARQVPPRARRHRQGGEHLCHQRPGAPGRVRHGRVARGRLHRPLHGRPTARLHQAAGAGRQRHVLAGRLQPHALPADALRQLVPDLRCACRAGQEQQPGGQRGRQERPAVHHLDARLERRHHAQLLPGAVARRVHRAGRHPGLGDPRTAGVVVRRRQRPVELHRRPHGPGLARRP